MGMTPAGGLVMSSRAGDLDPGIITFLLRQKRPQTEKLIALFENRLRQHHQYIREFLDDMPEIKDWKWQ